MGRFSFPNKIKKEDEKNFRKKNGKENRPIFHFKEINKEEIK